MQRIIGPSDKLIACILADYNLYQEFQSADQRDLTKCLDVFLYTFPITDGTTYSFTHIFQQSSYYFIILLATTKLTVQFSYLLKYQFYDLGDYQSNYTCQISSKNDWQDCRIPLDATPGCFFASANQGDLYSPNYLTELNGTLHHKKYTSVSTSVLAVGGTIIVVALFITALMTCYSCLKKKWCFTRK